MSNEAKKQTNLFGEFVEGKSNEPTVKVRLYNEVVDDGDQYSMAIDGVAYNEEMNCITLFDNTKNVRTTLGFENHPNTPVFTNEKGEEFSPTPDGIKFGKAVQKAIKRTINDGHDLEAVLKDGSFNLHVKKVGKAIYYNVVEN